MAQTTHVFTLSMKQNHIIKIFRIVQNSSVPKSNVYIPELLFSVFSNIDPNDVLIAVFIDNFKLKGPHKPQTL